MPDINHKYPLVLDAYLELQPELSALPPVAKTARPGLDNVLAAMGPLPREALFLGIASDGWPVLLNLHDPVPGPLLVVGEPGAGKTRMLRTLARSLTRTHSPDELQYGIVTDHPDEWTDEEPMPHRVGVFSTNRAHAQDFILSLASWAHGNKESRQSILLLVDDLEAIAKLDFATLQNFRWLLARGPSRRVWPVITLDAERYGQVISWIPNFRTRIFGRVRNQKIADALGGDQASALDGLEAPSQFSLRENGGWIRFWVPGF